MYITFSGSYTAAASAPRMMFKRANSRNKFSLLYKLLHCWHTGTSLSFLFSSPYVPGRTLTPSTTLFTLSSFLCCLSLQCLLCNSFWFGTNNIFANFNVVHREARSPNLEARKKIKIKKSAPTFQTFQGLKIALQARIKAKLGKL
jgi:hypothetical protein